MKDTHSLCHRLIAYFTFEPGEPPPGLAGFRAREGLSLAEFEALKAEPTFAAAVKEARARYLDTLTAGALLKKYDTGFVKHLMEQEAAEREAESTAAPRTLSVEIRVVE